MSSRSTHVASQDIAIDRDEVAVRIVVAVKQNLGSAVPIQTLQRQKAFVVVIADMFRALDDAVDNAAFVICWNQQPAEQRNRPAANPNQIRQSLSQQPSDNGWKCFLAERQGWECCPRVDVVPGFGLP